MEKQPLFTLFKQVIETRQWKSLDVLKTQPESNRPFVKEEDLYLLITLLNSNPPPKAIRLLKPLIVAYANDIRLFEASSKNAIMQASVIANKLAPIKKIKNTQTLQMTIKSDANANANANANYKNLIQVDQYSYETANRTRRHRGFRVRIVPFKRHNAFHHINFMRTIRTQKALPRYTLENVAKRLNIITDCSTKPSIAATEIIASIVNLCDISLSILGEL